MDGETFLNRALFNIFSYSEIRKRNYFSEFPLVQLTLTECVLSLIDKFVKYVMEGNSGNYKMYLPTNGIQ